MNIYRKIITVIILTLMIAGESYAAKWKILTCGDDISKTLEELNQYCIMHDMKPEDVLWANKTTQEDLQTGQTIYLPANHVDMLSIWQNINAAHPGKLVPKNSDEAAKKALAEAEKAAKAKEAEEAAKAAEAAEEALKAEKKAEAPLQETASLKPEIKPSESEVDLESLLAEYEKPEKPVSDTKVAKVTAMPAVQPAKSKAAPSPANVIKETAKPDKILTAKAKKSKNEIPGLMDPIIIFSPNGDPSNGPMRLVISGDKVEVVRLPNSAAPKRPSVADLNNTFGNPPSYLKYYDVNNLPKRNNYVPPNMVRLNGKMMWPVDGKVSSPFGKWRGRHMHQGIDIPMPNGTPIRAANTGVVTRTGNNSTMGFRGYGNFVLIDHGSGVHTFYAHCSSVAVREGQRVMQGQIIGAVGSTGRSTANHLHFEVRVNDVKVDPMPYLGGNQRLASTTKK